MTFTYKGVNTRKCYWQMSGCIKGLTNCAEGLSAYRCQEYLSCARVKREQKERAERMLNRKVIRALKAQQ